MRIGFDFRLGGINHGGIGRYSQELLEHLVVASPADTFVVFYHPDTTSEAERKRLQRFPHIELIETPIRHYSIQEQLQLAKIIDAQKLDIVHFPNFNVPVRIRTPFVVTIHDMVHHQISGHKLRSKLAFYGYKYVIQKAATQARAIITVSESSKKDIVDLLKVSASHVHVIPLGITKQEVPEAIINRVREEFLIPRPYFLFVGVLERKKNIPALTQAFDIFLRKYNLDMDLVIAGKVDPHYPHIKDEALKITHKSRVIFTGFVDDEQLASLYSGAYAFVTASQHEGFGLPGVEAMSYSLPILASNTPVFNEIYDNAALFFDASNPEDIAEKMHILAKDPKYYEQCQERSLRRAELFSWQVAAEKTLFLYNHVITTQTY